jgi:glucose/mannose-6-phosphate isomerase
MSATEARGAEHALDRFETLAVDRQGLIALAGRGPEALRDARGRAEAVDLPFPAGAVREAVVCGMGGSAIAGDLVADAYSERLRRPLAVVRDYSLPGWVGRDTLVILSSYSGNTEETLTCAMQALEREALVVAVTSGGKLAEFYGAQGVPVVRLPGDIPQPRAAVVHLLVSMLVVLERMAILPALAEDLGEGEAALAAAAGANAPERPVAENPAKRLAAALNGGLPIIYGAEATAAVARRWKGQINENAKLPAAWAALPELDHNEIVGFEAAGDLGRAFRVVMLRDPRHHRQVHRRFELTKELVAPAVDRVLEVTAEGRSPLARVLDLVSLGDYASLYLACLRGIDPGPVDIIERLKDRLATTGYGRAAASPGE